MPSHMGFWKTNKTYDTYLKKGTGSVVKGSLYSNTTYLAIGESQCTRCTKTIEYDSSPPTYIKAQCDAMPQDKCSGFAIKNDLTGGYLCHMYAGDCWSANGGYIKMPTPAQQ